MSPRTAEAWEQLRERCEQCDACGLGTSRTKLVFGVGRQDSPILFVGEGPGQQEDLQGEPFVGAAGKLLDEMLSIIDLGRDNCYIANVVKCRPPGNRDPKEEEQAACLGYLYEQIRLIQPKLIVCLGRIAAGVLIQKEFRITRQHGQWIQKDGVWYTAIYHPSALLRDLSRRPETFIDLLAIREKIREICPEFYRDSMV
ncbi:MAG: uracil-DNA glycosylase [Oscillospiraceae bacterium]|nr:uracil-DNA glycosylase [Oscillospiraceae bacterium]